MEKQEVLTKMEQKGMSVAQVAEAIGFDKMLLNLYLAPDTQPMPTRLMKKLSEALAD